MSRPFTTRTCCFLRDDRGTATIDFVLWFSLMMVVLLASLELAVINLRHSMLDRAVDLATREIRLSTGDIPSYDETLAMVCNEARIAANCTQNLRLEMVQVDPRDTSKIPYDTDCQNAEEQPRPVRNFEPGQDNDMMMLKACFKYKPILPTAALAKSLEKDEQGYARLTVTSAFVQEPR